MAYHTTTVRTRFLALLGLSRFQQAVLNLAEPIFVVLVALKALPDDPNRIAYVVLIALAGYLAIFAANDLLDIEIDRPRVSGLLRYNEFEIDWTKVRHPLAQNYLSFAYGIVWTAFLALFAIVGAFLLNPISAVLFVVAGMLEIIYCKLAKVSALKFLASGMTIATSALAIWFMVTSKADFPLLVALLLYVYAWEVGGRNIIRDWMDMEEDTKAGIKTVPTVYGRRTTMWLIMLHLALSVVAGMVVGGLAHVSSLYYVLAFVAGNYLMLGPGLRLAIQPTPEAPLFLLNRARLYPFFMILVLVASFYLPS